MHNKTNLEHFLRAYCEAFRQGNIPAVVEFYYFPATMIFDDRVIVITDKDKGLGLFNSLMDDLIKQNFDHSRVDSCYVHPLTDRTALISASFTRLKKDGSILQRLGATYTIVTGGNNLKIAAVVAHGVEGVIVAT
jgi:hypothetical protein